MKKIIALLFLSVGLVQTACAQFSTGYYALKDINLIDGKSDQVLMHYTVLIRGNQIEAVGPNAQLAIPDGAVIFNYAGKYLMPGLIDTHVHLATEPSKEDSRARAERDLAAMLMKGITTVRDMAGDARALASLARDAQLDDIVSPDIYYTAMMAGPVFFADPRTHASSQGGKAGEMPFMKAVTQETNMPLAIAEAKGTGATAIKLYAQLDGELAKKIGAEAHRQGLQVWSHADLTIASPMEVVNAGANVISHAGMLAKWPSKKIPDTWLKGEHDETF
jgi:imidazolonepropionase-like amidohydrolase